MSDLEKSEFVSLCRSHSLLVILRIKKNKNKKPYKLKYLHDITFCFISPNKAFLCMYFTLVKMSRHYGADSHHDYTDVDQETPLKKMSSSAMFLFSCGALEKIICNSESWK